MAFHYFHIEWCQLWWLSVERSVVKEKALAESMINWGTCYKYSETGLEFEQFYNSWYTIPFICWVLQQKQLHVHVYGKSPWGVNDKFWHMCCKYTEIGQEFEQFYNSWYTIPFICWVLQQNLKELDVHVYGKSPCRVNDKFRHMCYKYSDIGLEFEQFYNTWYIIPFICWVLQQKELDVHVYGKSLCRVNDKFRHMCYKYSDIGLEFEQFYNTWYIILFICWVLQQKELDVHFIMLTNNSNVTRELIKTEVQRIRKNTFSF